MNTATCIGLLGVGEDDGEQASDGEIESKRQTWAIHRHDVGLVQAQVASATCQHPHLCWQPI